MSPNLYVVFIVLTIFSSHSNSLDEITFKNVTLVLSYEEEEIATISSSKSLKGYIPSKQIDSLHIFGKIPVLWENSVTDIDNVAYLTFFMNKIEEIRSGAFKNLTGVKYLEISHNNNTLTTLKEGVFDNLEVQNIILLNNAISKIEVGAFRNLPQVETLCLQLNKLETLNEHLFDDLRNLKQLDLSKNQFSSLPVNVFRNLPNLEFLTLAGNKFDHIPAEVFSNFSVQYLDLSFNLISTLQKGIFKDFPKNGIILSHNKITTVPKGVFNNNLQLDQVHLEGNQISYIAPNAFDDMPKLANVILVNNKLTFYDPTWFHNAPNIFRLHLSNNFLEEIPDEAFKNIYNHKNKWIKLDSNKIKRISPNAFKGFKRFSALDLSYNQLGNWNGKILADAEVISRLNLAGNQLKCIDGHFDEIFKANVTYIQGNPLNPDCLKKIKQWEAQDRPQKHLICHSEDYCVW